MYMIKITGVLAVMIGVVGLLDSWKKMMDQRLSFLADFSKAADFIWHSKR